MAITSALVTVREIGQADIGCYVLKVGAVYTEPVRARKPGTAFATRGNLCMKVIFNTMTDMCVVYQQ